MTNAAALRKLYAIHAYRRLSLPEDGKPYGPGFFKNRDTTAGLTAPNRRVILRLRAMGVCQFCGEPLDMNSGGDHLIPLSQGGAPGVENYAPLCGPHNLSKGKKDFLEWWQWKGRSVVDIHLDLMCAYLRLTYEAMERQGTLGDDAGPHLRQALSVMMDAMRPEISDAVAHCV